MSLPFAMQKSAAQKAASAAAPILVVSDDRPLVDDGRQLQQRARFGAQITPRINRFRPGSSGAPKNIDRGAASVVLGREDPQRPAIRRAAIRPRNRMLPDIPDTSDDYCYAEIESNNSYITRSYNNNNNNNNNNDNKNYSYNTNNGYNNQHHYNNYSNDSYTAAMPPPPPRQAREKFIRPSSVFQPPMPMQSSSMSLRQTVLSRHVPPSMLSSSSTTTMAPVQTPIRKLSVHDHSVERFD
jgi:hypothetical protein